MLDLNRAGRVFVLASTRRRCSQWATHEHENRPLSSQASGPYLLKAALRFGIEVGKSFDIDKVDPAVKKGLERVPQSAQELMKWKVASLARVVNGWSMNTDPIPVVAKALRVKEVTNP